MMSQVGRERERDIMTWFQFDDAEMCLLDFEEYRDDDDDNNQDICMCMLQEML